MMIFHMFLEQESDDMEHDMFLEHESDDMEHDMFHVFSEHDIIKLIPIQPAN